MLEIIRNFEVHGLAHITGGGVRNLLRLKKGVKFVLDNPFEPQPIFRFVQERGNVSPKEMYQTFNMGMGFCIVAPEDCTDDILDRLERFGDRAKVVGHVKRGEGVYIPKEKLSYV